MLTRHTIDEKPSVQNHVYRAMLKWQKAHTHRDIDPVPKQRADMERMARLAVAARQVDVHPLQVSGRYAEWLIPPDSRADRAILYLHGGGYAMGSCSTHRAMVSHIAQACQTQILLLDYRLAPEHPFPAAIEDTAAAYQWLLDNRFTPDNILFMGDSAGGGLSLSTLLMLRDMGETLPAGAVLMSPYTDLATRDSGSMVSRAEADPMNKPQDIALSAGYIADNDPSHPLISPLFAELHGLPPLFIQVGDDEIMLDHAVKFAEKASATGVEVTLEVWMHMWHIWQFFTPFLPEAKHAIQHSANFVQERFEAATAVLA